MRGHPRYLTLARARIAGLHEGEALLKDLSVTGCRLEFSAAIAFSENDRFRITVIPEDRSEIASFELEARPVWSRAGYDNYEIGFFIAASPKGKGFLRYVDYLAWRSAAPENSSGIE